MLPSCLCTRTTLISTLPLALPRTALNYDSIIRTRLGIYARYDQNVHNFVRSFARKPLRFQTPREMQQQSVCLDDPLPREPVQFKSQQQKAAWRSEIALLSSNTGGLAFNSFLEAISQLMIRGVAPKDLSVDDRT